jgi:hypothetical protein
MTDPSPRDMRVIRITSLHDGAEAARYLTDQRAEPLGRCSVDGPHPHHVLVADAGIAITLLGRHEVRAVEVAPPLPVTRDGVRWWKSWRESLPLEMYVEFRSLHHHHVRSRGSLIRVHDRGGASSEPWRVLADAGVDVRCEFHFNLPEGPETHLLVPDAATATTVLELGGIAATAMDYAGPRLDQGISWWGKWRPALAYAGELGRPILLSFASPRVEQVPGVW